MNSVGEKETVEIPNTCLIPNVARIVDGLLQNEDDIFMQFLKIFITATDPNGNNPSVVPPLSGATWP